MKLQEALSRINASEIVIAERIEDMPANEYVTRYAGLFSNVIVEIDEAAGVTWLRKRNEVNS